MESEVPANNNSNSGNGGSLWDNGNLERAVGSRRKKNRGRSTRAKKGPKKRRSQMTEEERAEHDYRQQENRERNQSRRIERDREYRKRFKQKDELEKLKQDDPVAWEKYMRKYHWKTCENLALRRNACKLCKKLPRMANLLRNFKKLSDKEAKEIHTHSKCEVQGNAFVIENKKVRRNPVTGEEFYLKPLLLLVDPQSTEFSKGIIHYKRIDVYREACKINNEDSWRWVVYRDPTGAVHIPLKKFLNKPVPGQEDIPKEQKVRFRSSVYQVVAEGPRGDMLAPLGDVLKQKLWANCPSHPKWHGGKLVSYGESAWDTEKRELPQYHEEQIDGQWVTKTQKKYREEKARRKAARKALAPPDLTEFQLVQGSDNYQRMNRDIEEVKETNINNWNRRNNNNNNTGSVNDLGEGWDLNNSSNSNPSPSSSPSNQVPNQNSNSNSNPNPNSNTNSSQIREPREESKSYRMERTQFNASEHAPQMPPPPAANTIPRSMNGPDLPDDNVNMEDMRKKAETDNELKRIVKELDEKVNKIDAEQAKEEELRNEMKWNEPDAFMKEAMDYREGFEPAPWTGNGLCEARHKITRQGLELHKYKGNDGYLLVTPTDEEKQGPIEDNFIRRAKRHSEKLSTAIDITETSGNEQNFILESYIKSLREDDWMKKYSESIGEEAT